MNFVFGEAEVMRFGDGVKPDSWIQDWLRNCLDDYLNLGFGPWAVVKKDTLGVIGYMSALRPITALVIF